MHPDYLVSRVNVGQAVSLEPKVNRVLRVSLDILARWAPQGSLVLKGTEDTQDLLERKGNRVLRVWMVPWVPVDQRVREESEECPEVQEKKEIRGFKASLVSRVHPDLQAFQEKQDHQGLQDLQQKRVVRECVAPQG